MIESMHIENFKCFKSFDIELGKFNVLIGPNDSGKTAFLQAVRLMSAVKPGNHRHGDDLEKEFGFGLGETAVWKCDSAAEIRLVVPAVVPDADWLRVTVSSLGGKTWRAQAEQDPHALERLQGGFQRTISPIFRLDPRAIRRPCALPEKAFQIADDGEGLPGLLLGIAGDDPDRFKKLRTEFEAMFGYTPKSKPAEKMATLFFESPFGDLPAAGVSDGVVLSLAFMAISSLPNPPSILLIEEPENGVHHASLKRIVDTLRHLSDEKDVQVIATTHSPYLLDLVKPEDVRIFTKDKEGAVTAKRMSDAPEVDAMKKHDFQTGEIWTCLSEERLVRGAGEKR